MPRIYNALNMQDTRLAETRQSLRPIRPEHQQRQRQDQQFEGGENFDYCVGGTVETHGKPASSVFIFNIAVANFTMANELEPRQSKSSEKWWWFRFPGRNSRKSTGGCRQDTHSQYTSVPNSLCTSAERTHNALGSRIALSLCAKISVVIWCDPCLIHGCSLRRLPPWAPPLLHLPIPPHTENTQYIPHISKLPQSTCWPIKNHSGVKTCRVAETRAPQLHMKWTEEVGERRNSDIALCETHQQLESQRLELYQANQ